MNHLKNKKKLNEWTFVTEADDDMNDPSQMQPPMDDPSQMQPPMDDPSQGGQPGGDPSQMQPPMDDPSQSEPPVGEVGYDGEDESDDDTQELSVDDLTNAQEKLNNKMNAIGTEFNDSNSRIDKLFKAIDKMDSMINQTNSHIENLKQELEKRNPTPVEKLEMRAAQDSYPFNIKPSDYWSDKAKNSNYDPYPDDEKEKEYTITGADLMGSDDETIAKTFDIDDDMKDGLDIRKMFNY